MNSAQLRINQNELLAILHEYGVDEVSVFGSFARGEADDKSDLDLLVTYRPGTTLFNVIDLQDELEQRLGRKVDLVSKKSISERLAKRIKSDIKPLPAIFA